MTTGTPPPTFRPADGPEVVLDISRLLSRVHHATPTGVDRVEMAYARALLEAIPDRLVFAVVHPLGRYGRIPTPVVRRFLDRTEAHWNGDCPLPASRIGRWRGILTNLWAMRPRTVPDATARHAPSSRVFLQSSPHHLTRPSVLQRLLAREAARFVVLLHDLIPIEYPEYARAGGSALHLARVRTIAMLADGIIANSQATLDAMLPHISHTDRKPPIVVAHLGLHRFPAVGPAPLIKQPYFLCLGTIEPRKNHLLLLNIWRRMTEQRDRSAIPPLVLVGRRGWENEQIVDMLDRCPALVGLVHEHAGATDKELVELLSGARGLLLPSFAEGYGMPVTEALANGVPVICSDLPALREAGGAVPDYLDPLDGPAWIRTIDDYTACGPAYRAQMTRLDTWVEPTWTDHFKIVLEMVGAVAK